MAETMTQAEIDAFLKSYSISNNGEAGSDNNENMQEVKFHYLICIYCHDILESKTLDMHILLANSSCKGKYIGNTEQHMYVSGEWLKDRKENYGIAGWRRKQMIKSQPQTKCIPKIMSVK